MMTKVVNVRVKYIRPVYLNLEEWMKDIDNNLYIGRSNIVFINKKRFPTNNSPWCNPFKIGVDGSREEVIKKYRAYIKNKIDKKEVDISELENKQLGCWCKEEGKNIPCHGDVLVELLKEFSK